MKWMFSSIFGIIGVILLVVGCPFLALAAGTYYYASASTADWVLVPGTVTGMSESHGTDSEGFANTTYCPYVAFETAEGEAVEVSVNECSSPPAYDNGDSVEIFYNPDNPQQVRLKGGVAQMLGTVFAVVFGLVGAVLAGIGLVLGVIGVIVALRKT
jgi:hypothetical protein